MIKERHKLRGVGYDSKGIHKKKIGEVLQPAYIAWRGMLQRCYDPIYQEKRPTYKDCTVAEEWFDYQVFAEWFYSHPHRKEGYHLDKDLLVEGNKVYSPETCCFVPNQLNSLLVDKANSMGEFPRGVAKEKSKSKFRAQLSINGKLKHLGSFATAENAYMAYKEAKERYVKNKALEWANRIEWNVFVALMNWELKSE